jgi:hypothetical protein
LTTTALSDDLAELLPGYYVDPWRETGAWCSIPWPRSDEAKLALLTNSLGPQIIDWAEGRTKVPGLTHYQTGAKWKFTDGQKRFLILWYAYDPITGRWLYRSGVKRGAKGTGKDPFGAAWCLIELLGPSRLAKRKGRWVGVRHRMPLVQIASNSEAQSKDVLRVANAMLSKVTRMHFGIDAGETRTIVAGGGRLEVLTASEKSSEGDPATAIMLNESHHMTQSSGGHVLAAVARRNVGKSPAWIQARVLEFTNAHVPGADSVAEQSYNAWQAQVGGHTKRTDILYDSIEAPPTINLHDDASRMAGLRAAYMDAHWSDLERLSDEVLDPRTTVADSIRYYLNGLAIAEDAWIDPRAFDALGRPAEVVKDREQIVMFLDCSKSSDATGLVACRLSDGHVFTLGVWERPHGWPQNKRWLAPKHEVDAAVRGAMKKYRVVWFGVDPSPAVEDDDVETLYWMPLIDEWHRDFRKILPIWATSGEKIGHSVLFDMRISQHGGRERNKLFTAAAMQTVEDIEGTEGAPIDPQAPDLPLTHDGHPVLRQHAHNARRRTNPWGVSCGKVSRDSDKKVDLAVCMIGARMGRRIALNSGKLTPKKQPGRVVGHR